MIGFPERYEGLKFRTRGGDAITALMGTRDYCLVMTARSTYIIQGYTEDDLKMDMADPEIGSAGHSCNTQVNGIPYITTRYGFFLYNGSWQPIIKDSQITFAKFFAATTAGAGANSTRSNSTYFQTGLMVHNPLDKTIQLFMGYRPDGSNGTSLTHYTPDNQNTSYGTFSWVLNYDAPLKYCSFDNGHI